MTLDIVIGVGLGLFLGWLMLQYVVFRTLRRFEQTVATAMQAQPRQQPVILARAEQQNQTFYIWAIDDGRFLAQGTTLQEILQHLVQRPDLANSKVEVVEGDQDVLDRLRAAHAD